MKPILASTTAVVLFLLLCLLMAGQPFVLAAAGGDTRALLAVATEIGAVGGYSVTVPIAFAGGGNQVGSITFSLDFDEGCLAFDGRDRNNDGRSDAVRFTTPPAFRSSASYNGEDTDGELDVVIADYSLPIATLPDNEQLMLIDFTALCMPAAGTVITAPVRFSLAPRASFGDPSGIDVDGTVSDGFVAIYAELPATATPTPSPTLTASATPGPGTPTVTPTATATPTATVSPTPNPGIPTPRVTPLPTAVPGTPTPVPNKLYLPLIRR